MERPSFCAERRSYGAQYGFSRVNASGWRGPGRSLPARRVTPVADRMCASSFSSPLTTAAIVPDDGTVDTISSRGAGVSKAAAHSRFAHPEPFKLRHRSQTLRDRDRRQSVSALNRPTSYDDAGGGFGWKNLITNESELSQESDYRTLSEIVPTRLRRYHSNPAVPSTTKKEVGGDGIVGNEQSQQAIGKDDKMQLDETPGPDPGNHCKGEQNDELSTGTWMELSSGSQNSDSEMIEMFKQPNINKITENQLIDEVRSIYSGLVMVEKKCIQVDKEQMESTTLLSGVHWQALISLHRTLLYEHHDFFFASQHPSASLVVKRLAEKYAMPARMWRYGIHSFLELLRRKLPNSLEYMLNFIYLAYSIITNLLESVTAFRETWIECLGDLARYRMAVEESDMRDRELWAGVSRYWYNQDADISPEVGRIQHHLAVLARPDVLQQLFHYTKALMSARPFPSARASVVLLLTPFSGQQAFNQGTMVPAFVATHCALFHTWPRDQFITLANHFLTLLREEPRCLGRQGLTGVYIMSCNFASILQYGDPQAVLAMEFSQKGYYRTATECHKSALNRIPRMNRENTIQELRGPTDPNVHLPQTAFFGSALAFQTLSVLLDQLDEPIIYPSAHISLSFIWSLALRPPAMQQIDKFIPWAKLARFLNSLVALEIDFSMIEEETFPLEDAIARHLPEDFLIRGQLWSQLYYPENFFEGAPPEDDRPVMEPSATSIPRKHRCLWLGVRIATFGHWMRYNNRRFHITPYARENLSFAESCGGLRRGLP